ncbi:MAG: biopolymer transporter ExbD [Byssovorax sp.]
MKRALATSSLVLLALLAACNRAPPAPSSDEGMIVAVPGLGPMRCTPIGSAAPPPSALPLDLPRVGGGELQMIFGVELHADGAMIVDGKRVDGDAELLARASDAITKNRDLRAVIRADTAVPHGRVIRVLDILKQAGISKIAFGVTPIPPGDAGPPPAAPGTNAP